MGDYLSDLVKKNLGSADTIRPRFASRFEPLQTQIEPESFVAGELDEKWETEVTRSKTIEASPDRKTFAEPTPQRSPALPTDPVFSETAQTAEPETQTAESQAQTIGWEAQAAAPEARTEPASFTAVSPDKETPGETPPPGNSGDRPGDKPGGRIEIKASQKDPAERTPEAARVLPEETRTSETERPGTPAQLTVKEDLTVTGDEATRETTEQKASAPPVSVTLLKPPATRRSRRISGDAEKMSHSENGPVPDQTYTAHPATEAEMPDNEVLVEMSAERNVETAAPITAPITARPRVAVTNNRRRETEPQRRDISRPREQQQKQFFDNAEASEPPVINVTIGRIEVRAVTPPAAPRETRAKSQTLSLDEYLKRRSGGEK